MLAKPAIHVLLVEDNPGDARLIEEMLKRSPSSKYELSWRQSMEQAIAHFRDHPVDVALLDLGLPDAQGLEVVRLARGAAPRVPLVVLTGLDDESFAAKSLQEGIQDYLIKGQIEQRPLIRALRYAIERKNMEDALSAERERAQTTLNCIGDAIVSTDTNGNISYVNQVAEQLTSIVFAQIAGQSRTETIQIIDAASRKAFVGIDDVGNGQTQPVQLSSNCVLVRADGVEVPIEGTVAPIHDEAGQIAGEVYVFRDVSEARAMAKRVTHMGHHDFLTGLPNRLLLNDRLSHAISIAPRHQKKVVVLFLDLDGFKHINDSLGHPIGDKLLKSVAERLLGCVRMSDTVSRQGGDEFVVLLSEVEQPEDAAITARRMLTAIAETHSIDRHELHVTTTIGVSVFPDDGLDAATLIKNADTAMYQGKENGRNSYQFFKPAMNVRAVERQMVEEGLRRALERREFALHYQPKVSLSTGRITGAEALIRWTHPTRGPMSPAQFIPVAEACGLIRPIGNWVLYEACRQAQAWMSAGLDLPCMAVNISALEFSGEKFLDGIFDILEDTGLDPGALELELTESVLMKRADAAGSILKELRARGVQLAVDDFGTGYSSLSYLRNFPIHTLKIDQSFIREIGVAGFDSSIVTAVLSMARNLRLRVIAEGVETPAELAFLQSNHCDEAQGYYFSRPLPAHEFERLLRDGLLPTMAARQLERAAG